MLPLAATYWHSEWRARLVYPVTLGTLIGFAVVLIAASWLVRTRATYAFDLRVTKKLQQFELPGLTRLMRLLTYMSNGPTLVIIAVAVIVFGAMTRALIPALYVVGTLVSIPLNLWMKTFFDRERPGESEVRVDVRGDRFGYSYPSGHSMCSAAFYVFLAFLVFIYMRDYRFREPLVAALCLLPIGIGISRIYLGDHWLSDVVGGWAFGLAIATLAAVLYPV
ncbi:MAG: phosphatase PAP2 family protein [Fimbriimonas sp.]